MLPIVRVIIHSSALRGIRIFNYNDYIVTHIKQRNCATTGSRRAGWSCTCPDYQYVKQFSGNHCKHIKVLREFVIRLGGWAELPNHRQEIVAHVNDRGKTTKVVIENGGISYPHKAKMVNGMLQYTVKVKQQ